ncbi:MAG: peptide chain release factor 1 [Alphaproteobacteria bacterium]|nr:peptide chain release factor 1 [Alphaproteobacteria bacterium]
MIIDRHAALEGELAMAAGSGDEFVRLSKEYAELTPVVEGAVELQRLQSEVSGLEEMLSDPDTDGEMRTLAEEELVEHRERLPALEDKMQVLLLPQDAADRKNAILEIRAGTGGDEAALFAADLYRMYQRYAELKGWKVEALQVSETDLNGVKEAQALISGAGVFARLKFESGVHRVQRVPETESSGRIHTSAATVAVLPEAEDIDVEIDEKDLRVDVYRASGPGGQSVNTTDSAVRITHLPTGIVVTQQDEKSQHKNRAKALKILRSRLYDLERERAHAERAEQRRGQVGSGDRSERVRTYNFPQGRVTDHRINLTLHKLDRVLAGESLDEVIDGLIAEDQASRLAEMEADA